MKRIVLAMVMVSLCSPICVGKTIEETATTIIYHTANDLSANNRRLAQIMLSIEKRFPGREKYVIEFTHRSYKYLVTYEPAEDIFTKQENNPTSFREQYSEEEVKIDETIQKKIYKGNAQQRLLLTEDGSISGFAFSDDVVTEKGQTITYEVPKKEAK